MPDRWKQVDLVYYDIECRVTQKCRVGEKLQPVTATDNWSLIGQRHVDAVSYLKYYASSPPAKNPKIREGYYALWQQCGHYGWLDPKLAVKALKLIRQADAEGKYDYRDGYGKITDHVRHEFRLVSVRYVYQVTPVTADELVDAIA